MLVVHHDPYLDDGRVMALTRFDELPEHVPTLQVAIDACEGMWVNVEVKNDASEPGFDPTDSIAVQTAAELVLRGDPLERWVVSSFRRESVDIIHATTPSLPTAWLCLQVEPGVAAAVAAAGHVAIHPWVELLTAEAIAQCHDAGLRVNVWTCDDPERMAELIALGVDGVCTNVPDIARQVVDTGRTSRSTSGS